MSLEIDNPPNSQHPKSSPLRRFDQISQTWIDFKSESDALLASFWLGEELGENPSIPIHILDALIALLRLPDFSDKLTYSSGADILTGIAASRRSVALVRSMSNHSTVSSPVPSIIVDLVAQELGQCSSLPILDWEERHIVSNKFMRCVEETDEQKALKNMCLVHRTWTIPARRVFSWCVDISGTSGLYHFLRSPGLGQSTRILRYTGNEDDLEMRKLLSAVIRQCLGLRDLRIDSTLRLKNNQFLEDISGLSKLEKLQLGHYSVFEKPSSPLLLDVCQALPRMEALKSLTLHNFVCCDQEEVLPSMHELSPCSRLKEINLSGYYGEIRFVPYQRQLENPTTIDCISWLFKLRNKYKVTSATIHTRDIYELSRLSTTLNEHGLAILPILAGIDSLHLPEFTEIIKDSDLLSRCTHIKHVKLSAEALYYIYDADEIDCFSETLETLELERFCLEAETMSLILQSLPSIRSLRIHPQNGYLNMCAGVELLCHQKGIAFTMVGHS